MVPFSEVSTNPKSPARDHSSPEDLALQHRFGGTGVKTATTLDAPRLINPERFLAFDLEDRVCRASTHASLAPPACLGVDLEGQHLVACFGRAAPVMDVCLVLLAEESECAEDRIGCCLSQTTEAGILDTTCEVLKPLKIPSRSLSFHDAGQNHVHLFGAKPTRWALAARFLHTELHEEPRNIHHAGILIHDDESA